MRLKRLIERRLYDDDQIKDAVCGAALDRLLLGADAVTARRWCIRACHKSDGEDPKKTQAPKQAAPGVIRHCSAFSLRVTTALAVGKGQQQLVRRLSMWKSRTRIRFPARCRRGNPESRAPRTGPAP